jgi:Tol biopolymer transport system component
MSPDGTRVAFQSDKDHPGYGDVFTVKTTGGAWTRLTNDGLFDWGPAWSPNGKRIAWARGIGNPRQFDIFTSNPDGTNRVNVTKDPSGAYDIEPSWSPDGSKIVYSSDRDGYGCIASDGTTFLAIGQLYEIPATGGTKKHVVDDPSLDASSPDWFGSRLGFAGDQYDLVDNGGGTPGCGTNTGNFVYVVPAAGGGPTKLTAGMYPSWSTTGAQIAFAAGPLGNQTVKRMKPNGTSIAKVTTGTFPDWRVAPA